MFGKLRFRVFALVTTFLALLIAHSSKAQDIFITSNYTIDAAHSVLRNAFVGEDSSGNTRDSLGNLYNPTVSIVDGGNIGSNLTAGNSSTINMTGGTIIGSYSGGIVVMDGSSTINFSGGVIGGLYVGDNVGPGQITNATANITGGQINNIFAQGESTVNISGGVFGDFESQFTSSVNVTGGSFSGRVNIYDDSAVTVSGGTFNDFADLGAGTLTFIGTGLSESYFGYDDYDGGNIYVVTGTLADGYAFHNEIIVGSQAKLNLEAPVVTAPITAAPEPSSLAEFVLGTVGMCVYVFSECYRKAGKRGMGSQIQ